MRAVVLAALPAFNGRFEGRCAWMYLDNHKAADGSPDPLVTTGVGNLIDPLSEHVLSLPWAHGDGGAPASREEIAAEWEHVKSLVGMASGGGGAFAHVTALRLPDAAIDGLARGQIDANEAILRSYFPQFETFPADAQLGIHSMAYALGAAFARGWPKFAAAANRGDWKTAAEECQITHNAPVGRNLANKLLFLNASRGNPAKLYYPKSASGVPLVACAVVGALGAAGYGLWKAMQP